MVNEHIVKSFDEELKNLERTIIQMGGMVEQQLADALKALSRRDSALAERIIGQDLRVDALNQEIDQAAIRMLALRQPMASDLRTIVSALRMAGDLERIGDYAKNVAKRTVALNQIPSIRIAGGVQQIGMLVSQIIKDVLDAFTERDAEKAKAVWARDEQVDALYTSLFRELLTYMMEDPRNITACTHILFIAKNIERMGDHATNVAETIYFVVTGTNMVELRPKGDNSSFTVMQVPEQSGAERGRE